MNRINRWWLAGLLLVPLLILACIAEWNRRNGLYWYDVTLSHDYRFSGGRTVPVDVDAEGFEVRASDLPAHSALLKLEVASTWFGRWAEPAVEVTIPGAPPVRQYFERGARGTRYLNLGHLLDRASSGHVGLALRGEALVWEPQQTKLYLFDTPRAENGPVLVIAPHPDDAEIAAFGLYSDTDSWIVTVTSGNTADRRMAHLVANPAGQKSLKGELRSWDSVAVPLWGGVPPEQAVNLGYFTLSLEQMYAEPNRMIMDDMLNSVDISSYRRIEHSPMIDRAATSTWESLVDDLSAAIAYVQPAIIVAPHPVLDRMVEHKLTTVALLEALSRIGEAGRRLFLYSNHAPGSEYFPFGPADSLVSLPPWPGDAVRACGFYSHRLSEERRLRKLYALEANHDLRPAPRYVSPESLVRFAEELTWRLGDLVQDPTDTYSYMRRAARPNEIFLVVSEAEAGMLEESVATLLQNIRKGGSTTTSLPLRASEDAG